MDTITTTQPPFHLKNLNLPPPPPPPSISELRHISAALSQFLRDYDDLHSHIGSVNAALDEKLSAHCKGNTTPLIVGDCNNNSSVKNVLECPVVVPNPRHSVSECVSVVSERKRNECDNLASDSDRVVNDALEVDVSEGVKNYEQSDVIVVVLDGKCKGSDEDVGMYESSNSVKKREESDCVRIVSDDLKEIVLEGSESECECGDGNALVKMEESDCAEIIIDVSEAVVLEQNLSGSESDHIVTEYGDARVSGQVSNSAASECEQGDDDVDVRMDESPNSPDSCKDTDSKGEKIDAAKNVEETDYDRPINELPEEIAMQKNPIRTRSKCDNVSKPQSSSSLENSEETDDEDGEIEASKGPEDADYDHVDVVPKPNRTASDPDHQSYDKPQSPTSSKNHLDEIDVTINSEDKNHEQTNVSMETNVSEKHEEMDILKNPAESVVSEKPEETDVFKKPEYVEILKNPKPAVSELQMLCKRMSGREMKKYVVKHICDIDKLRTELLKALKLAINPAKLVLDSIGTYFLESSKTYHWGSFQCMKDQIDGREASLLILECFVMISGDGIEISREDEAYAAEDANRWKTRMINEGLENTEEADARGLLLFISGFGISDRFFGTIDLMNLMRASNVKGISNILRRSIVLMPKIPEVIDMMVMSKLAVEAADIAYTFGLEDKCRPLTILMKFLRSIIDDIERKRMTCSKDKGNEKAIERQLDDLTSVKECLKSHNIDPLKVLPKYKIDEEIHHLKKELKRQAQNRKAMDNKKKELKRQVQKRKAMDNEKKELKRHVQKRKAMDNESLPNLNHRVAKRTCFNHLDISLYNESMQQCYDYRDINPNLSSSYTPMPLLNAPTLPINTNNSVTDGFAGPSGNIQGPQDVSSAFVEKNLFQPYLGESQTYDAQSSYGRQLGFPVCMSGRPGYLEYIPSGGFPTRRCPSLDRYAFADVEKETRGSRVVGSRTSYFFMEKSEALFDKR